MTARAGSGSAAKDDANPLAARQREQARAITTALSPERTMLMAGDVQHRWRQAIKKLAFKAEVAEGLPHGLGDEQRLTQVLLNLVGNAIKFTDAGEVRVTAKSVNGHFAVSVADTGPGIPEQEQTRIFDQFHQVDGSLTKAKGGTGLGLAIAKQIVEVHGGPIWVESTTDTNRRRELVCNDGR
jgi:signal transduction histidine kinase